MALDISLLYGEMIVSALLHMAIIFGLYLLLNSFPDKGFGWIVFIVGSSVCSWILQFIFLSMLQSSSCGGVKSYGSISIGATIASLITAIMVAIPLNFEIMRTIVSHLFIIHQVLITPSEAHAESIILQAASNLHSQTSEDPKVEQVGGGITEDEYKNQTLREMALGAGFWAAFAGAYGIGIGSLWGAKCG